MTSETAPASLDLDSAPPELPAPTTDAPVWTTVIRPRRSLLDLRLGELWQCRDLISLFVWRDFVAVYKQTILGPLWHIVQPLLTTLTFTVIFGRVAVQPERPERAGRPTPARPPAKAGQTPLVLKTVNAEIGGRWSA